MPNNYNNPYQNNNQVPNNSGASNPNPVNKNPNPNNSNPSQFYPNPNFDPSLLNTQPYPETQEAYIADNDYGNDWNKQNTLRPVDQEPDFINPVTSTPNSSYADPYPGFNNQNTNTNQDYNNFYAPQAEANFGYPEETQADISNTPANPGYSQFDNYGQYPSANTASPTSNVNPNSFADNVDLYSSDNNFNNNAIPNQDYANLPPQANNFEPVVSDNQDLKYDPGFNNPSGVTAAAPEADPYLNAPEGDPNTFEVKKSGTNKFVYIIAGVVIFLLLAIVALMVLLRKPETAPPVSSNIDGFSSDPNNPNNNPDINNTPPTTTNPTTPGATPKEELPPINTPTGTDLTPAQKAKKFNATKLTTAWILKNFSSQDRDELGVCQTNKCLPDSDPDNDGLKNIDELNYQTDPQNKDTASTNISDGDKVYIYSMDPLSNNKNATQRLIGCFDPNTSDNQKMTRERLKQITDNSSLRNLYEPTVTTLRNAGATNNDLVKGYIENSCVSNSIDGGTGATPPAGTSGITNPSTTTPPSQPATGNDSDGGAIIDPEPSQGGTTAPSDSGSTIF